MPMPNLNYNDSGDNLSSSVRVLTRIMSDLDEYNATRARSPLLSLYTRDEFEKESDTILQGIKKMREEAEGGLPPIQGSTSATMSYTWKSYDVKSGWTEKWLDDATEEQITDEAMSLLESDNDLLNNLFFIAALTRPTTSTTSNTTGFYYGQTDVPNYASYGHYGSAHTHYLATDSASAWASTDIVKGRNHIWHHGYAKGIGGVTFYANQNTMDSFAGLAEFTSAQLLEARQADGFIGRVKGVNMVVEEWIPDSYGLFLPTASTPAVIFKQHRKAEKRGLVFVPGSNPADPIQGSRVRRVGIGMNIVKKGAGVAIYKGSSWTNQSTLSVS